MLTEEKLVNHAMALIMIMFVCVYNIQVMCTHASFSISFMVTIRGYHKYKDIWVATEGEQLLCKEKMIPSVASTAMATSLFASLMADGGIIVERSLLGRGVS